MTRIVSYYPRNTQFQLSSQEQLADAQEIESVEGFKWVGRTLTSWTDQNNVTYASDQTLTADSVQPLKLYANWELNKYNVSVDFKSEHGKVIVTTSCDELPLFSSVNNSIELTKDGQTSSNILYNSLLSIDVVPESENYTTTRFDVNGISQSLLDQYVYRNTATDDKTGDTEFIIIVDFVDIDLTKPLTFTAQEADATMSFKTNSLSYEYSQNGGEWTTYTSETPITLDNIDDTVSFRSINSLTSNTCEGCQFTINSGKIAASGNIQSLLDKTCQRTDVPANCYSSMFYNSRSLTQAPELPATTLAEACYMNMFQDCTSLTQAPKLPATTLAEACYTSMFAYCTSLTQAPKELPATTLAYGCYLDMFNGCTSLTSAPELPATTLADACYGQMFDSCTSLTSAPKLPATTLAENCYYDMFGGCTSLTTAPELPATTLADYCYDSMFCNCSNLSSINVNFSAWDPSDATTDWVDGVAKSGTFTCPEALPEEFGVSRIPEGWKVVNPGVETPTDLTEPLCFTAEDPGATITLNKGEGSYDIDVVTSTDKLNWTPYEINTTITLTNVGDKVYFKAADGAMNDTYEYKFSTTENKRIAASGNLNTLIKADGSVLDFTITSDNYDGTQCYDGMFSGCTSLTQAPELPATTLAYCCYYQMFEGCTSLTSAPELPATTLANTCYYQMFSGCASLTSAPKELPATALAENCYYQMFSGCASLTSAPKVLPATALAKNCYYQMFSGCASLTSAPELPATTLADSCYSSMFFGCTSLTQAPELPATTLATNCYPNMFSRCTSLTAAPKLPAETLATNCYHGMFTGCTSLEQAPELPATTLAVNCYRSMFSGCNSLTQAPELPATTLAGYCYQLMFEGCASLTSAPELPATALAENCYYCMFYNCSNLLSINVNFSAWDMSIATANWVKGVAESGTFTCPEALPEEFGVSRIPEGWKVNRVYPEEIIPNTSINSTEINAFNYGNDLWW